MEKIELLLRLLGDVLVVLITVIGFVLALLVYIKEKRSKVREMLINEAVGFYYTEKAAIEEIAKSTGENERTVQKRIRDAGKIHPENVDGVRPSKAPHELKKYLNRI